MATTRAVASKALSRVTASKGQVRQLSLTGSASLPIRNTALDQSGFRPSENTESRQRAFKYHEFQVDDNKTERLRHAHARSFSTSDSSYGSSWVAESANAPSDQIIFHTQNIPTAFNPTNQSRKFNSSRNNKAVGDSSTIDFAHLPVFPTPSLETEFDDIRVPLLPHISRTDGSKAPMASEVDEIAASPFEIVVVSAESTHLEGGPSGMAEAQDSPKEFDFQGVAKQLALGLERENSEEVRKAKGLVKQVWTGFVDDLFGQKSSKN